MQIFRDMTVAHDPYFDVVAANHRQSTPDGVQYPIALIAEGTPADQRQQYGVRRATPGVRNGAQERGFVGCVKNQ